MTTSPTPSRITVLSTRIASNTSKIDAILSAAGLPSPSFRTDVPPTLLMRPDIQPVREQLLEDIDELQLLIYGPAEQVMRQFQWHTTALHTISRFNLFCFPPSQGSVSAASSDPLPSPPSTPTPLPANTDSKTPSDLSRSATPDSTTYAALSSATGLPESILRRILRSAMTYRIFEETEDGLGLKHTGASKLLAQDPAFRAWIGHAFEELGICIPKVVDAITKWPNTEEPNQCAYNLTHSTTNSFWQDLPNSPERASRFAQTMTLFLRNPAYSVSHLLTFYPWSTLPSSSTVVDIGGNTGSVARHLISQFPNIGKVIVQDRGEIIEKGRREWEKNCDEVNAGSKEGEGKGKNDKGRIEFLEHDFFEEQPVKGADVYLLRWILHDWSDDVCKRILEALTPALKAGSKVVVNEIVVPRARLEIEGEEGVRRGKGWVRERTARNFDLAMKMHSNGRERDLEDWKELFGGLTAATGHFKFIDMKSSPESELSVVVFEWA